MDEIDTETKGNIEDRSIDSMKQDRFRLLKGD